MNSVKKKKCVFAGVLYFLLICCAVIFCFPIFMLVSRSLMTTNEATLVPARFWPEVAQWKNYAEIFEAVGEYNGTSYWWLWFKNTVLLELGTISGTVLSSVWVAYGFTRIRFPGRNIVFAIVLGTMMIPSTVTMIPLYTIFSDLHWLNTLHPLIWPMWCGGNRRSEACFPKKQIFPGMGEPPLHKTNRPPHRHKQRCQKHSRYTDRRCAGK